MFSNTNNKLSFYSSACNYKSKWIKQNCNNYKGLKL